jgi:hypothetical protein
MVIAKRVTSWQEGIENNQWYSLNTNDERGGQSGAGERELLRKARREFPSAYGVNPIFGLSGPGGELGGSIMSMTRWRTVTMAAS